jgi:hypothetical protein
VQQQQHAAARAREPPVDLEDPALLWEATGVFLQEGQAGELENKSWVWRAGLCRHNTRGPPSVLQPPVTCLLLSGLLLPGAAAALCVVCCAPLGHSHRAPWPFAALQSTSSHPMAAWLSCVTGRRPAPRV